MEVFLAVLRGRSLDAAAELMGVNHSTAYRRLTRLEQKCGGRLFDRHGATYDPTPLAKSVVPVAMRLEREAAAFRRALRARSEDLSGRLRVAIPGSLLALLRTELSAFRRLHPHVTLSLEAGQQIVDLVRGDADVAIRLTSTPDPELIGRRMAGVAWAVYSRVEKKPEELPWIRCGALSRLAPMQWSRREWPDVTEAYGVDSPLSMIQMLCADDVAGYCMCYLADAEPVLRRLSPIQVHQSVWLLYAPELRKSPLVRSFIEAMSQALEYRRPLLEGSRPSLW